MTTRYALATPAGYIIGMFYRDDSAPTPPCDAGNSVTQVPAAAPFDTLNDQQIMQQYMISGSQFVNFVPTLAMAQQAQVTLATAYLGNLFYWPNYFTYQGNPYQVDTDSQASITAMGSLAAASIANPSAVPWPGGFYWIDANNNHQAMTAAQMLAFAATIANYVSACILNCAAIKAGIRAAATVAAVKAIDVQAGYPTPAA